MIDADFERMADGVIRLLDERTADEQRVCARCLGATVREVYFENHFYCGPCVERADDFPWRTTHGGLTP